MLPTPPRSCFRISKALGPLRVTRVPTSRPGRTLKSGILFVEEINWASFWTSHGKRDTRGKAKDRWQLYLSPHRNFAMMYLRAYREMKNSSYFKEKYVL